MYLVEKKALQKNTMNKITINGEDYIKISDVDYKPTVKQIVVLNRGWVVVGDYSEDGDNCTLSNASVIRKWGTTEGLGELAEKGKLGNTVLDKCPNVHFNKFTVVARMDVNLNNWK